MPRILVYLVTGLLLTVTCPPAAVAQARLNPQDLAKSWTVRFLDNTATFNLGPYDNETKQGKFTSEGSLGPAFGGPNPLNATRWRVEGDQLVFFHISRRLDDQVILAGKVEFESERKFRMTLRRGTWVNSNQALRGKAITFE
jgi:hypothetical protein